jgi:hypothetical protein
MRLQYLPAQENACQAQQCEVQHIKSKVEHVPGAYRHRRHVERCVSTSLEFPQQVCVLTPVLHEQLDAYTGHSPFTFSLVTRSM